MNSALDPALERAIADKVGHPPPTTAEERESVSSLSVKHARDLTGIADYPALRTLILTGCDPVSLTSLAGLDALVAIRVQFSALRDVVGVPGLPQLLLLTAPANLIEDLTPLLDGPKLSELDVSGNPLSDESYHVILPELRRRGWRIVASDEREWQLTRRMHAAGYPFSLRTTDLGPALSRPGLAFNPVPEDIHPFVSADELEALLDSEPHQLPTLFERAELLTPPQYR